MWIVARERCAFTVIQNSAVSLDAKGRVQGSSLAIL
jgi:hypothetical protein